MSRSLSIFLDALRFLAALMVVLGHFTQPYFSHGYPDLTLWAISAVSVFFVLSGFVIAHVTHIKEKTPLDYTVARISRLYSVLLPALVLTLLVHLIAAKLDPAYLTPWVEAKAGLQFLIDHARIRFLFQYLTTITFLNGVHNHDFSVALDNPVWSLGFEAPYYAIFGIFLFTRGAKRWALFALCALVFGFGILELLPVWLSGVALHRLTLRLKLSPAISALVGIACLAGVAALFHLFQPYLVYTNAPHGPLFDAIAHPKARANGTPIFYYWGLATWLLILAAFALQKPLGLILIPLEKPIRWCAGHTFSLYLFHFPLLVLIYVTTHYDRASHAQQLAVLSAVLALCALLSQISEEKKRWWRSTVRATLIRLLPHLNQP